MKKLPFSLSYEKILLIGVIIAIWTSVLLMEKLMPHQALPILVLIVFIAYCTLIATADLHRRRMVARGSVLDVPQNTDYQPSVSIIVPAHNEGFVIADTIHNLMSIDYPNFDLWVFDDRSIDNTPVVLQELSQVYPDRFYPIIRPANATPGKSAVLNEGLALSKGDVILVLDADGRINPDFLRCILPYLADSRTGAVQARKVIVNASANRLTRCQHHEYLMDAHFQRGRDAIRGAVELRGNGQLVKREALLSVEGWTEDTVTDDLDLSTKLHLAGWDIRFAPHVEVYEEGIVAFRPLLRQRRRWAEGSLKRYLEYLPQIFTAPDVSKRVVMDMLGYFLKFLFPLWAVADITVQVLNMLFGHWPSHWISTLLIFPALCIFFLTGSFLAIREYTHQGIFRSAVLAVQTATFLMVVWVPVVMWITAKTLISRDTGALNWGKTEHLGTQAYVKPSRLTRIKNFFHDHGIDLPSLPRLHRP